MPFNRSVRLLAHQLLEENYEQIPVRERRVIKRLARRMARSHDEAMHGKLSFGDRLADEIAAFGGSWTFIIAFGCFLLFWVMLNTVMLVKPFDPYPYILLNLFLSMIAAIQAPIIMMSQNRQAKKDRAQATHDYEVNLKAEIEIMALHDKLDEIRTKELAEVVAHLQRRKARR